MTGENHLRFSGNRALPLEAGRVGAGDQRVRGSEHHRQQARFVVIVPGRVVQEFRLRRIRRLERVMGLVEAAVNLIEVVAAVQPRPVVAGVDRGHQLFAARCGEPFIQFDLAPHGRAVDLAGPERVDHVGLFDVRPQVIEAAALVADSDVADEEDIVPGRLHAGADLRQLLRRPAQIGVEIHDRAAVPLRIVRMFPEQVEHSRQFFHLLVDGRFDVETGADLEIGALGRFQHRMQRIDERGRAAALIGDEVREKTVDALRSGQCELPFPVLQIAAGRILQRKVVVVDRGQARIERRVPRCMVRPCHLPVRDFRTVGGGDDGERQSSRTETVLDFHGFPLIFAQ